MGDKLPPVNDPEHKPTASDRAKQWRLALAPSQREELAIKARERARLWASANQERVKEYKRRYRQEHPEKAKESKRRAAAKKPEKYRKMAAAKAFRRYHAKLKHDPAARARNREKANAYRAANLDLVRERDRKRAKKEKAQRAAAQRRFHAKHPTKKGDLQRRRRAIKLGVPADLTDAQWKAIVQAHEGRCHYCGVKPPKLERDHVIPATKNGGYTAANIVPACRSCNASKGDRERPYLPPAQTHTGSDVVR